MLNIETLKLLNSINNIAITEHARIRLIERGIVINDVVSCIASGEIIKQYEDDKPLPSCLVLGRSRENKQLHIVVSMDEEFIYLITAYYPDLKRWETDYKTRREK